MPIYPLTDGINQRQMRLLVEQAVDDYAGLVQEAFPEQIATTIFRLRD